MKIRGIQIAGKLAGNIKELLYIKVKYFKMTIDTTEGSYLITEDEIIAYIKNRRQHDETNN